MFDSPQAAGNLPKGINKLLFELLQRPIDQRLLSIART
jgi:hypothetical protein